MRECGLTEAAWSPRVSCEVEQIVCLCCSPIRTDSKNGGVHVCARVCTHACACMIHMLRARKTLRNCFSLRLTDQCHRISAQFVINKFYSLFMERGLWLEIKLLARVFLKASCRPVAGIASIYPHTPYDVDSELHPPQKARNWVQSWG